MRFKYITILVFFIVQTSIDASGSESYPECLETSEGCAPTTDSPTTDSPVNSWSRHYCGEDQQLPLLEAPSMLMPLTFHIPPVWGFVVVFLASFVTAVLICCSNFQLEMTHDTLYPIVFYHITGLIISIIAHQQFVSSLVCTAPLPGHIFFLIEFTLLSVVMAYNSREWKHLKCVKNLSALTDPNINIWRELNLETPEILLKIKCYHGEDKPSTTTYEAVEPVPYSFWWIGDDTSKEGDPIQFNLLSIKTIYFQPSTELRSRSQTYISTAQNKLTFLSLKYSKKAADKFTTGIIEQEKSKHHELNKHRDVHCEVSVEFGPTKEKWTPKVGPCAKAKFSDYSEKLTFKPENMKVPLFCRPWFFWLFTVLPFPFFNGVLLRMIIAKFYSVTIKKPIVQFLQILPETDDSGVVPVPVMDITKGYQVTQSVMDLIEQKHGSNQARQWGQNLKY